MLFCMANDRMGDLHKELLGAYFSPASIKSPSQHATFFSCLCFTFPTMPEEQQNSIVKEHDEHESEQSEEEETENQVDNVEQGKDSNK